MAVGWENYELHRQLQQVKSLALRLGQTVKELGSGDNVEQQAGLPLEQLQTPRSAETPFDMPKAANNHIRGSIPVDKTATNVRVPETCESCVQTAADVEAQPDLVTEMDDVTPRATDAGGCSSTVTRDHAAASPQLAPGTRVRMMRDVCGWLDRLNEYFVDNGWQGVVLEAALPEWDVRWFRSGVDYIYVKFRHPPDEPRDGCWWDTLDGQCYYTPRGVKLAVRAADIKIME